MSQFSMTPFSNVTIHDPAQPPGPAFLAQRSGLGTAHTLAGRTSEATARAIVRVMSSPWTVENCGSGSREEVGRSQAPHRSYHRGGWWGNGQTGAPRYQSTRSIAYASVESNGHGTYCAGMVAGTQKAARHIVGRGFRWE